MSDFLNKFEDDQYDGDSIVSNEKSEIKTNDIVKKKRKENSSINQDDSDEIVVYDKSYKDKLNKKKLRYGLLGSAGALVIILIVLFLNIVKVPNLVDKNVSDAKSWAQRGNINLITSKEYSTKYDENEIISQEKKKGKYIFKNSDFEVVVSQGANPDEKIEVPNLMYMDIAEITSWKDTNKLDNVVLDAVFSSKVPNGKVVDISYDGDFVNAGNYYRKDTMTIKVSKGKIDYTKSIAVPDFKATDIYGVKDWAEENKVTVSYSYQRHPKIAKDGVIKQSIKKGTKMSRMQTLEVVISLGKGITVPNFAKMNKDGAAGYSSSLNLSVKTVYSSKVKYGKFISQSIPAGTRLYSNKKVTVVYSEGRPFIENIKGYNKKQVEQYFYKINLKGARLSYKYKYVKSSDANIQVGSVVRTSVQNNYANFGQTITVSIKK